MRRTAISRVPLAIRRMLVWFASVLFVMILAGCGAFDTATPTVSPDLLRIDAIETRMQAACDDFIRQQSTLTTEGAYDLSALSEEEFIESDELPDAALSLHVERAYADALAVFEGMDADSPDADAARAMIARIAPMQQHAANLQEAFLSTVEMIGEGLLTEADPLTFGPMAEWRSRFVELCAEW